MKHLIYSFLALAIVFVPFTAKSNTSMDANMSPESQTGARGNMMEREETAVPAGTESEIEKQEEVQDIESTPGYDATPSTLPSDVDRQEEQVDSTSDEAVE